MGEGEEVKRQFISFLTDCGAVVGLGVAMGAVAFFVVIRLMEGMTWTN